MAIRVTRNEAGNCITFLGSTNPVYWNSCLSAQINEDNDNNIDVINDIRSVEEGNTVYEFYSIPYTSFQDKDGNDFDSPSAAADYITLNANVVSNTGTFAFSQLDLLDAQRDSTNTTVLFSNGDIHAVNSLVASANENGTIDVKTVRGDKSIYTDIRHYNVSVNDGVITGFNTVAACVDRLNEVLSGSAIGSNTGTTITSTTTSASSATFTVYGDRITETGSGATLGYTSTREEGNFDTSNGIYSNQTISKAGEYFEFSQDQGDWSEGQGIYIGLFDETTYDVADLEVDEAGNAVKSVLYLRLKNSPFLFADSTDNGYGKIIESGFNNSPQTKETFRLGLDQNRRGYIAYEKTDGTFEVIGRTATAIAANTDLRMIAIMPLANELNGIRNATVNEEVLGASFTWYYIESPDGDFHYPFFADEASAITVDELYGTSGAGLGVAHAHTYIDDTSGSTWYVPDTYHFHDQTAAPTPPAGITYNEITTGTDSDYVPSQFNQSVTVNEGDTVNLQIVPLGDVATYSLTNVPAGLAFNSTTGYLQGTAPDVSGDTTSNPTDVYSITVTKANDYGSSVGTLTFTVNNLTAPAVAITGFTHISGSATLVDSNTLDNGSAVSVDETVQDGYRFKMTDSYVTTNILPALQEAGDKVFVGFAGNLSSGWGTIGNGDFTNGFRFEYVSSSQVKVARLVNGAENSAVTHAYSSNLGYDFYLSNDGGVLEANYNLSSTNNDTEATAANGGSWTYTSTYDTVVTESKTIVIASVDTQVDISTSGLSEHALPASGSATAWTRAIDFSGGAERMQQVNPSTNRNAIYMNGASATVSAPSTSGYTVSSGHPWATAIVFTSDKNSSNQHIWNLGEGTASTADNIYLRTDATGKLYFGWGRDGALNEFLIHPSATSTGWTLTAGNWYGIYIAHNGTRLSGTNATAANLAAAFDIRLMGSSDSFTSGSGTNLSTSSDWVSTGGRMDRQFQAGTVGSFTIGGRGSNRNFHGKVASMVVTTLKTNTLMPSTAEIEEMLLDPMQWLTDYKVGNTFRLPWESSNASFQFAINDGSSGSSTQVWLMGDGASDSFNNNIRNQVQKSDNSNTRLDFVGMQSSDIETVSINGLS